MNYAMRNSVQYINPVTVLSMNPSQAIDRPNYQVRAFKLDGIIDLKIFKTDDAGYIVKYKARSTTIGRNKSRAVRCNLQGTAVTRLYKICTPVPNVALDLPTVSGSVFIDEINRMQRIVSNHSFNLDVQQDVDMLVQSMVING